jgi:hypothetical protein
MEQHRKIILGVILAVFVFSVLSVVPSVKATETSTQNDATSLPFQRKSFYANGRHWVWYSNGTDLGYCTSTDGLTWSNFTAVRNCTIGNASAICFDGTYVHYVYSDFNGLGSGSIYYRRGTPNSNGTITWPAAEQTVLSATYDPHADVGGPWTGYLLPSISVDSNGYPYIGYVRHDSCGSYYNYDIENLTAPVDTYYPYVTESNNNNGTWSTASGFPYQLSGTSNSSWAVSPIPLTSGKMLAIYAYNGTTVKAQKYDGSSWGSEANTTSAIGNNYYFSAAAQGDNVHLVFLKTSTYDIIYTDYTYSSNSFGTETTVQSSATSTTAPVLSIDTATNDLYCFWAGSPTANHIYYKKYNATTATWDTNPTDWINESSPALTGNDVLTCFYQSYSSKIGLEYMTATSSPYNVKYASLVMRGRITTKTTITATTTATNVAIAAVVLSVIIAGAGFIVNKKFIKRKTAPTSVQPTPPLSPKVT